MSGKHSTFSIPPPLQTWLEGSKARQGWDRKAKLRVQDMLRGEQGCWGRAANYKDKAAYEDWTCAGEEEAQSRPDRAGHALQGAQEPGVHPCCSWAAVPPGTKGGRSSGWASGQAGQREWRCHLCWLCSRPASCTPGPALGAACSCCQGLLTRTVMGSAQGGVLLCVERR